MDADGLLRGAGEVGSSDHHDGLEDERAVHAAPAGPAEEAKPKKTHRRNRSLTALLPTLKAKPKRSTDEVSGLLSSPPPIFLCPFLRLSPSVCAHVCVCMCRGQGWHLTERGLVEDELPVSSLA